MAALGGRVERWSEGMWNVEGAGVEWKLTKGNESKMWIGVHGKECSGGGVWECGVRREWVWSGSYQ